MIPDYQIPEPFLFNPLKHHLGFMRDYIAQKIDEYIPDNKNITRELKHLGTSVMDVYTGNMTIKNICREMEEFLVNRNLNYLSAYSVWTGMTPDKFKIISLTDGSQWTLKFHNNNLRFVHIFPARNSPHTFRVKSNTLKSAMIYSILIGKDYITGDDLNKVRPLLGLSPVKDTIDTEAILEMIEILRD